MTMPIEANTLVLQDHPPDRPGWWARHVPGHSATWYFVSPSGGDVRDTEPLRLWLDDLEVHVALSAACGRGVLWAGPVTLETGTREVGDGS